MYFRKIRPSTTCLYSAASMWPRSLSAAAHSFCSKPRLAPLVAVFSALLFAFAISVPLCISKSKTTGGSRHWKDDKSSPHRSISGSVDVKEGCPLGARECPLEGAGGG